MQNLERTIIVLTWEMPMRMFADFYNSARVKKKIAWMYRDMTAAQAKLSEVKKEHDDAKIILYHNKHYYYEA